MKKKNKNGFYIFFGGALLLTLIYKLAIDWAIAKFGITIKEILYTLLSPLNGADTDFLKDAVIYCIPWVLIFIVAWTSYSLIDKKLSNKISAEIVVKRKNKKHITISFFNIFKFFLVAACIISICVTSVKADGTFKVVECISSYLDRSTIYEDYYVSPDSTSITAPENKKNLIYIYLESMETTYASEAEGGNQPSINYIPKLTDLANQNISFSDCEGLGGFYSTSGTTWTMGSLFATTAGVPFSFPVNGNSMNERENFAAGITTLGDILQQNGYRQEFLCGSDGSFAGRKNYFNQHGNYEVFDLYSAREAGYIPEDYYVWWGFEDSYLYEIAKERLTELAAEQSQPFNFTMLTVDTHHVSGYLCKNCPDTYGSCLENVLTCADSQIYDFIKWCEEQPFYENTAIIITGDHPRMDTTLVADIEKTERTIYNCFINTDKDIDGLNLQNRAFTAVDIFPTVLSALNFEIDGDRLGLGTNMFSDEQTLAEIMGMEEFESETSKYSQYYIENFS